MKSVKFVSSLLYHLFKLVAFLYLLTAVYVLINCSFEGPFFEKLDNNRFAISYPFSNKHFLLGSEYTVRYVTEMVLGLSLYAVFFFVLSGVFAAFKQEKLFTHVGIKNLRRFYQFNLMVYPVAMIVWSMFSREDFPYIAMLLAHLIMGVFIYFMCAIFEQGVKLQNEQDLFV